MFFPQLPYLPYQAIHDNFANCKEFQDWVNDAAETDDDVTRTKEMIDVIYLYRICIEVIGPNIDVLGRCWCRAARRWA